MDKAEISKKRCFSFSHVLFQAPPFFSFGGRRKKSNVAWLHQKITQKAKRKRGNKATANLPGLSFFFWGGGRGNILRRGACFQILTQKVINLLPILSSHFSSFKNTSTSKVAASLLHYFLKKTEIFTFWRIQAQNSTSEPTLWVANLIPKFIYALQKCVADFTRRRSVIRKKLEITAGSIRF